MSLTEQQLQLPHAPNLSEIINVASVPHRSPFRYPGGKTWLVPRIRQWLKQRPAILIEPFAGGASVGLAAAAERLAGHVQIIEKDEQVAAVWEVIITLNDGAWLADKITSFDLTPESLADALAKKPRGVREIAFQTILKNRTFRGGILAPGAAPLKRGENGKGIKSRWYPETLKRRILAIRDMRERITFIEGDGIELIRRNAHRHNVAFYLDPPYTAAGKRSGARLYNYFEIDHEELFRIAATIKGDFLLTYNDDAALRALAGRYNLDSEVVAMKNAHHAEMTELLIGRNLDWSRQNCLQ